MSDSRTVVRTLWTPPPDARKTTRLGAFTELCERRTGRRFADYDALWEWSVGEGLESCWAAVWDFFDVRASTPYIEVLASRQMPGGRWFEGATLNYAEHMLRHAAGRGDDVAVVGISQSRDRVQSTWGELIDHVARARAGLQRLGVRRGDCVAAYMPNVPETLVAMLAAASLGATWTACAPEFGVGAVLDRFSQVAPKVLLAVAGYRYGERDISRADELASIVAGLPSLTTTVVLPYGPATSVPHGSIAWDELLADHSPLEYEPVAPDHPLYVLYSSGTTGLPKPIVHGHGGILLEHLKAIGLHADIGPTDTFFWFTTTGWMMWNFLVSGLLVGARLVTFDGDPNHAGPSTLWELAERERITWFGVGSPFLSACQRAGLQPGRDHDVSSLRAVGATGAPLPLEAFRWVYEAVGDDLLLSPLSGGTDVCTAFVGGSPLTPVWEGEIPCRYLGCAVEAYDPDGRSVVGVQGEMVITQPMPSMPVGFAGDDDGSRYRAAYFEDYPGVWRHGDWLTITERGSCVITGRSDATLNRGGIRIGTAEIYRVTDAIDGVADSLVVHLEADDPAHPGTLVLLVVTDGELDEAMRATIGAALRSALSPRHVPDEIHRVATIPTTLSGKKLELPVKKVLLGADPDVVASRGALKDPAALDPIVALAVRRRDR